MEVKIDKRTKEYKLRKMELEKSSVLEGRDLSLEEIELCSTCGGSGKGEGCIEQGGFVKGLCPECCGHKGNWKNKENKESMEKITNPEIVVESDRLGSNHTVGIPYTKDVGFGEPVAVCTDPPEGKGLGPVFSKCSSALPDGTTQIPVAFSGDLHVSSFTTKLDYSKSENNPGFSLCGKCGEDKLEHNDDGSLRTRRQPEACRDCVWEHANEIVCEDGVIRAKEDCKRMTRMVGADEVFYWVKK